MRYASICCAGLALAAIAGCSDDRSSVAYGDENTIVVMAVDSLWAEVGDSVLAALEPRVFTTRRERMFEAEHISPLDERWAQLRQFRQVLVIGQAGDGWIAPVLEGEAGNPTIVMKDDIWARGQTVTALVVPTADPVTGVLSQTDSLFALYEGRFRSYAQNRMFASGVDSSITQVLRDSLGVALSIPGVYRQTSSQPYVFQSETQVGGTLWRTIVVSEQPGAEPIDPASLLVWRDSMARAQYANPPQRTRTDRVTERTLENGGAQIQGIWESDDPQWPEAGMFVTRAVPCPDRNATYFIDMWLLAPGRSKYEYLIQFETILDSFACAARAANAA